MNRSDISREQLQAFVDNQLDSRERSHILAEIRTNPQLSRQACELRTISELVKHAYAHPPESNIPPTRPASRQRWKLATAALILLGLGGIIGWTSHPETGLADNTLSAMYWDNERAFHNSRLESISPQQNRRIIVHLNTASPEKFESALATAETLMKKYSDSDMGAQIEVVANASAIKMLRAGYTPYAEKVRQLQERYFNLTFLACKDAIDHIIDLEGPKTEVELLPGVDMTPSALEHILERLKDGWMYINV